MLVSLFKFQCSVSSKFTKVSMFSFHHRSRFLSKFKFFIKVHKMLVSNVDFEKCQIHKILVSRVDFSKCQVFKIMDFLKCSRASQWHSVPGCILCKRDSPKRNAQKNILKNQLFKVHHGVVGFKKKHQTSYVSLLMTCQ